MPDNSLLSSLESCRSVEATFEVTFEATLALPAAIFEAALRMLFPIEARRPSDFDEAMLRLFFVEVELLLPIDFEGFAVRAELRLFGLAASTSLFGLLELAERLFVERSLSLMDDFRVEVLLTPALSFLFVDCVVFGI